MKSVVKRLGRDSLELTKAGVVLGVGASLGASGVSQASGSLPALGNVVGASAVISSVRKLRR